MDDQDGFPPIACDTIGSVFADENGVAYVLQWLDDILDEGLGAFCWISLGRA